MTVTEIDCRAFKVKPNPHPPGTVRHFMHGTPRDQWWFWYHHQRVRRRDAAWLASMLYDQPIALDTRPLTRVHRLTPKE